MMLALAFLGCSTCKAHTAQVVGTFLNICVTETYHLTRFLLQKGWTVHSTADDAAHQRSMCDSGQHGADNGRGASQAKRDLINVTGVLFKSLIRA